MDRRRYSPRRRSAHRVLAVAALSALGLCASPHGSWLVPTVVLAHKAPPPPPTPVPTAPPSPTPSPPAPPTPAPSPTPAPTAKAQPTPAAARRAAPPPAG